MRTRKILFENVYAKRDMKEKYRSLSGKEIQVLQAQGCRAANWNEVWVKDNFSPLSIENVRFGGSIYLGVFGAVF